MESYQPTPMSILSAKSSAPCFHRVVMRITFIWERTVVKVLSLKSLLSLSLPLLWLPHKIHIDSLVPKSTTSAHKGEEKEEFSSWLCVVPKGTFRCAQRKYHIYLQLHECGLWLDQLTGWGYQHANTRSAHEGIGEAISFHPLHLKHGKERNSVRPAGYTADAGKW